MQGFKWLWQGEQLCSLTWAKAKDGTVIWGEKILAGAFLWNTEGGGWLKRSPEWLIGSSELAPGGSFFIKASQSKVLWFSDTVSTRPCWTLPNQCFCNFLDQPLQQESIYLLEISRELFFFLELIAKLAHNWLSSSSAGSVLPGEGYHIPSPAQTKARGLNNLEELLSPCRGNKEG